MLAADIVDYYLDDTITESTRPTQDSIMIIIEEPINYR